MPALVTCPLTGDTLTPSELRARGLTLIARADEAEGVHVTERGMAHPEVVAQLAHLGDQVARIATARGWL